MCAWGCFFFRENISHSVIRNFISKATVNHYTCRLLFLTEDPVKSKAATRNSVWLRGNATTDSSQGGKDQLSHSLHARSRTQKAPCKWNVSHNHGQGRGNLSCKPALWMSVRVLVLEQEVPYPLAWWVWWARISEWGHSIPGTWTDPWVG